MVRRRHHQQKNFWETDVNTLLRKGDNKKGRREKKRQTTQIGWNL